MFRALKTFLPTMVMLILSVNPCMGNTRCITINVKVEHHQKSLDRAANSERTITRSSNFVEQYNSLERATSSSSSEEGSASGSYGAGSVEGSFGYSDAQAASIAKVASSASSMSSSSEVFKSEEKEFKPGFLQIIRETTIQIVIKNTNTFNAMEVDEDFVQSVPITKRLTDEDLLAMDEKYIERYYTPGNFDNRGTYMSKRCKEVAETKLGDCAGGDECCTPDNQCAEGEGDCDVDEDCQGDLKCANEGSNCNKRYGAFDDDDACCYALNRVPESINP